MGLFEETGVIALGTGERATHVPEQLGLEQRRGNSGAVLQHQRSATAIALEVNRPCDEFLARSALALNQHR